jgi:hypothetical protein
MSKYEIAYEFTNGFAAGVSGVLPRLSSPAHWVAGWDAGYECRQFKHEKLNKYLESIGVEKMAIVSIANAVAPSTEEPKQ